MAAPNLVKCPVCGAQVSDQAPTCPSCGDATARRFGNEKSKSSGCGTLVAIGFGFFVLLFVIGQRSETEFDSAGDSPPSRNASPSTPVPPERLQAWLADAKNQSLPGTQRLGGVLSLESSAPASAEAREAGLLKQELQELVRRESIGKQWNYRSDEDAMSGKTSKSAQVVSTNSFEFEFPYQGSQHATLALRKHPRWGNDVVFSIENGQLLCSSYDCPIRVRFDDEAPRTYEGNEPADNSTETIFIPAFNTISSKLAKAKTVRVEANVYQQGVIQAEFNVEGFDPGKLR